MSTSVFWNDGFARKTFSEKEKYARSWYCEDRIESSCMMISDLLGNKGIRFDHKGVTDKTQQCNF